MHLGEQLASVFSVLHCQLSVSLPSLALRYPQTNAEFVVPTLAAIYCLHKNRLMGRAG